MGNIDSKGLKSLGLDDSFYGEYAWIIPTESLVLGRWLDRQAAYLPATGRALDAACGRDAVATAFLVTRGYETFACDRLEDDVLTAQRRIARATCLTARITELDFPEEYFDVISCGMALLAAPKDELMASLRNLRRMLTPSGILLGAGDGEQMMRIAPAAGLAVRELEACGMVVKAEAFFRAEKI